MIEIEIMTSPTEQLGAVFFTVKYGRNQTRIFNANCKNDILLHYIKTNCQCSYADVIELSDERGQVKNIRNNKEDYGTKFIKERENVILLKVDGTTKNIESKKTKFIPLLADLQDNKAFMDAVNLGKLGEETTVLRRRSTVSPADTAELAKTGMKSKFGGASKKKFNRRQSSRNMVKK